MSGAAECAREIDADGAAMLAGAISAPQVSAWAAALDAALRAGSESASLRASRGAVYAARNLLDLWPGAIDVARHPAVAGAVGEILGERFGLVRAIFFDKSPGAGWSLPWHRDLAIAVSDNSIPSARFASPTVKAGVPHVEAPTEVLERMLTARIHLDPATALNGALRVLPGSHRAGESAAPSGLRAAPGERIMAAAAGDVLLMRPLLAHCSDRPREGAGRRRILHFEFAAAGALADGYEWHRFERI